MSDKKTPPKNAHLSRTELTSAANSVFDFTFKILQSALKEFNSQSNTNIRIKLDEDTILHALDTTEDNYNYVVRGTDINIYSDDKKISSFKLMSVSNGAIHAYASNLYFVEGEIGIDPIHKKFILNTTMQDFVTKTLTHIVQEDYNFRNPPPPPKSSFGKKF